MSAVRFGLVLSRNCFFSALSFNSTKMNQKNVDFYSKVRKLSSLTLSKNLELLSEDNKKIKAVNFKLTTVQNKPLVVMLCWMLAKKKHVYKFADFYVDQGFNVLSVNISPWQLLWPAKGSQIVAGEVLKFLDLNRTYTPIVIHGFSVGGYVWGEVLAKIVQEQPKYQHIIDKTVGQIWDSAADITEIPVGFPMAVFPNNHVLQTAFRQYILYHMKTFDKVATRHYVRSSQIFHSNPIKAPAQLFLSKIDPVGAVSSNQRLRESWESAGLKVYWKCFEDSNHVGHLHMYPKEYLTELYMFLDRLGLIAHPEKIKAKL